MKRTAIIIVALFAAGIIMSSCNRHLCPAYSLDDTNEQIEEQA